MGSFDDRPMAEPIRKVRTTTVLVVATTQPPTPGFRHRGCVIELDEEVRLPVVDAQDLERRGKARILAGTEKVELL